MAEREISQGKFMVIITVAALVLVLGIVGIVSESVLHSDDQVTGLVVITPDEQQPDPEPVQNNTDDIDAAGPEKEGG